MQRPTGISGSIFPEKVACMAQSAVRRSMEGSATGECACSKCILSQVHLSSICNLPDGNSEINHRCSAFDESEIAYRAKADSQQEGALFADLLF